GLPLGFLRGRYGLASPHRSRALSGQRFDRCSDFGSTDACFIQPAFQRRRIDDGFNHPIGLPLRTLAIQSGQNRHQASGTDGAYPSSDQGALSRNSWSDLSPSPRLRVVNHRRAIRSGSYTARSRRQEDLDREIPRFGRVLWGNLERNPAIATAIASV